MVEWLNFPMIPPPLPQAKRNTVVNVYNDIVYNDFTYILMTKRSEFQLHVLEI